jgi:single stranded DNA-binding protein
MARNYNKVILVGVIESSIVLRETTNGTAVTNFTVTTVNKWTDRNGEIKNYKKWHHIVCWGRIAEYAADSFVAGDEVLIEGSISYRNYEKDDKKLKVAEIKATSISKWEGSLNKIIIVGNVGNELSLRKTTNNTSVTNFSLSTIEKWKDKSGELKSHKKWHRTVCWGKTAENAVENVKSGALVLAEGSISYRTYVNKDGVKNNHIAEMKISQLTKWANALDLDSTKKGKNIESEESL